MTIGKENMPQFMPNICEMPPPQVDEIKKIRDRITAEEVERAERKMDEAAERLRSARDLTRTIVHVDMDAFYAAVEMRDDPKLREVPMAVGGTGMLCTSNYLARKFGVRAGMPGARFTNC
jgi:DNA polymerase kappa